MEYAIDLRVPGQIGYVFLLVFFSPQYALYDLVHFDFSDADLCKDRRKPTRWFHVSRGMEGFSQLL